MALLKAKPNNNAKPITLANNSVDKWKHLDGKTLLEADASMALTAIKVAMSNNDIPALVLETATEKIAFPFSYGFDPADMNDPDTAYYGTFYVRNKRKRDAAGNVLEGEDLTPTGPAYISFGKASGITFKEETVIAGEGVEA